MVHVRHNGTIFQISDKWLWTQFLLPILRSNPLNSKVSKNLGSTDAAPEVPHPRRTRPDAATRRGRRCPRVRPRPAASGHVDPTWVSSTRADASRFGFDARRREPIRAESGLNRPESAGIGRYRPKQPIPAEIQKKKKKPRTHRNRPKLVFDCLIDCLLFSFNFELVSCILICKHHGMF